VNSEEALIERIACMLYEPRGTPDDCPPLGERLIEAVDRLLRRVHALEKSEDELRMLRAAWAPVVHAAALQALSRPPSVRVVHTPITEDHARCCADTERAALALTGDQRVEAEP